jgi:cytochrome c oxidase subunit II
MALLSKMDKEERIWLGILVGIFLVFNVITLSPLVPWQQWLLWSDDAPTQQVTIDIDDYTFKLPTAGIQLQAGEPVEFVATSQDVTYGFGVFRPDGTMVFQMQVLPGHENKIVWKFDQAGTYDVRSTEYSGPRHSEMLVKQAITVTQ